MIPRTGLYDPAYEHDACGFGFVARVDGRRTRKTVEEGLEILRNLEHRGARGSDPETGDGAGMLIQLPDPFFRREAEKRLGIELPSVGHYAVGTLFESGGDFDVEAVLERVVAEEGQKLLGFRDVPVNPEHCGELARQVMPRIRQFFIESNASDQDAFERKLYVIRRMLHTAAGDSSSCYVVSLSSRTILYKGLLTGTQVPGFYPDLQDPEFASAITLVHERFSTNTLGSWELAHPYRYVAHNGEFNTLRGNINWMRARESRLESDLFGEDLEKLSPVIQPGGSDSAAFDNALELLHLAGRSLSHAVAMMIPEAWENDELMDPDRRAFYQYHSSLIEPWDGPAAVAFTDGRLVGATLDRNGLRPARYSVTKDGRVIMASEDGALRIPNEEIVERWRLQPGRMLVVDTESNEILHDEDVKRPLFERQPYKEWLEENEIRLGELPEVESDPRPEPANLFERQLAFGYTMEDLRVLLSPMAMEGSEPTGSMGTDTPLAVLSEKPQMLFHYFKQHFAQVTNPPIDPLREDLVMSLKMSLGPEQNLFEETPYHCRRVLLEQPILNAREMEKVRHLGARPFAATTLSTLFPAADGGWRLEKALENLCERAEKAVRGGSPVLVLSDRGVSRTQAPIPSLLATAAVHHHLVRQGIRTATTLVVETAEAREVHHFALLIGYGAAAVNPYLAFETIEKMAFEGTFGDITPEEATKNYVKAIQKGLLKVISKMGISTLLSYNGAQIFEAVGLSDEVIDRYFTNTASRIGGVGLEELAHEALMRHERAFGGVEDGPEELEVGGEYQLRQQGQYHQWNPASIVPLQRAVRANSFETFKEFTKHFDEHSAKFATLRGLMDFEENRIPIEEVEPAKEIVKRFTTGAMSLGSLSREAHETLALAMNEIGGKSNTGEGGEDPERFLDERRSSIKQVASGRFGVTTEYLVNSDVLQIKIAQGAKPGEGGQLPGGKISEYIAKIRYSTPGVGLISPPPHHDIYSIEDLAQLIHDLKNANPRAYVSVKLVSEVGVGTIAAGVAKAKADHITIAGNDGGTGASPLSSIKHAGLPWELGLSETQQVLVENDLRGRVIIEADGQLKTGRDIVVAALLGGEEFAFSTAPLVATGCIMMRVCHLNTCPVGIATQDPELRKRFEGTPEHVINYFFFLAEEVREYMAKMGYRRFEDMIGRSDSLRSKDISHHW
ncbi:MAG: glutamate synthase large subunit, partial [Rubrobacteraceae bacterium]